MKPYTLFPLFPSARSRKPRFDRISSATIFVASGVALVAVLLSTPRAVLAQTFTGQSIAATANIFGAGNTLSPTPNPSGGSGGTAAPGFALTPGTGRILTFSSVTGTISLTTGLETSVPDGQLPGGGPPLGIAMNVTSFQGISGIRLDSGSGFLSGVFLTNPTPADPAPTSLAFTNNGTAGETSVSFSTLSPLLNQQFFIGDGLTGNGSGSVQQFLVPNAATRLFLGIEDANGYNGPPGQYQDNSGAFTASFAITGTTAPEPSTLALLGMGVIPFGGLIVRRRTIA